MVLIGLVFSLVLGSVMENHQVTGEGRESVAWVFGYGSLVWRTNFPYADKVVGCLKGYARRFWQASTDHRGVPGAPGRVVTLIKSEEDCTWGVAFKVNTKDCTDVFNYLNHREKNGYTLTELPFHPIDSTTPPFSVNVYIATESNEHFLGPAPIDTIAEQVVRSRGPSGCNTEYVLELASAIRKLAPLVKDTHLFSLEKRVREILKERTILSA